MRFRVGRDFVGTLLHEREGALARAERGVDHGIGSLLVGADEDQVLLLAIGRFEAAYREKEDLILVGAYQKGSDPMVDAALRSRERALAFVQQRPDEVSPYAETHRSLLNMYPRQGGATTNAA